MLSLSTAFNVRDYRSWKKYLPAVKSLGFDTIELSVEVPGDWMEDIANAVEKNEIKISSLHNYCPRLEDLPHNRTIFSGYHINSEDEEERRRAVQYTMRTIEWAGRLRAQAVVLHAGEVPTEPTGGEFYRYLQQFGRNGRLYQQYFDAVMADRKVKAPRFIDLLKKSLDEVLPFARDRHVTVGLENRYFLHEIPSIDEVGLLLDAYEGGPLAYWHDTGHAEVFVRQGWVKEHTDFLKRYASKAVGCHLHDLRKLSDHYAPGSGDLDFALLAPYLKKIPLKVIEAHAKSTAKEVAASRDYLRKYDIC